MAVKILQRLLNNRLTTEENRLTQKRLAGRDCSLVSAIALSSATAGTLLALSQLGIFQSMEMRAFDLFTQLTAQCDDDHTKVISSTSPEINSRSKSESKSEPSSESDSEPNSATAADRIVIVAITEEDIQSQKRWPLSDQVFAQVLATLQQHTPQVIGLGVYRDVPHSPGTNALAVQLQQDNVIAITNLDRLGNEGVPSPLQMPESRVGFTDFVVDPDGVVRRNFMFAAIGDRQLYSFSLRLAEKFLTLQEMAVTADADALNLGNTRLPHLTSNAGGYQSIDAEGYQTLSRYAPPSSVAKQLTLTQVLSGDFDPDWINDSVVIIGTTAPSQKDLFYTPFSSGDQADLVTPGVELHAQMTHQLLSLALNDRAPLTSWSQWGECLWVLGWGMGAGLIAWRFTHPSALVLATGAGLAGLSALTLALFASGTWVPLALPVTTFAVTTASLLLYREFRKSFYDSTTGLPNRGLIIQQLRKFIGQSSRASVAVILVDIDKFKIFNESFGLQMGDRLLQMMAKRIRKNRPAGAKIARIAGDEFVILLKDSPSPEAVLSVAQKLTQQMAETITLPVGSSEQKLFPTVSTGIAFSHTQSADGLAIDAEDLLRDAQTATSRAKQQGRGRCEVFVQDMRAHLSDQLGLEADLREALSRQELFLCYQPLICLESMTLAGFEALIRWQHPTRGLISPAEFIPIAEDTGLIIPIGQWVLEVACAQAQRWQQQFPARPPFMSVNLSGRQFAQKDLVEQIARILKETGFNPKDLKLELTESVVMDDVEASIDVLLQLKALNLQLGIDDFGTGYSSLSYLHRFPIDTLKVDRSFVMEMESLGGTAELVKTIVALGHNLGMNVVAEGIETESQSEKLRALRCEYGQGYLFAKPLPVEAASDLLRNPSANKMLTCSAM
ncbi:MAG: EAL domain-containing protein [Cyanobacteria bacterium P01_C01_bin.69]